MKRKTKRKLETNPSQNSGSIHKTQRTSKFKKKPVLKQPDEKYTDEKLETESQKTPVAATETDDLVKFLEDELETESLMSIDKDIDIILATDMKSATQAQLTEHFQKLCQYIQTNKALDLTSHVDCLLNIVENLERFPYESGKFILHTLLEVGQNASFNYEKLPTLFTKILELNKTDQHKPGYVNLTTVEYGDKIALVALIENLAVKLIKNKTLIIPDAYKIERQVLISLIVAMKDNPIPIKLTIPATELEDQLMVSSLWGEDFIKSLCSFNLISILTYLAANAKWEDLIDTILQSNYKLYIQYDKPIVHNRYEQLMIVPFEAKTLHKRDMPINTVLLKLSKPNSKYTVKPQIYIRDDKEEFETFTLIYDITKSLGLSNNHSEDSVTCLSSRTQIEHFNQITTYLGCKILQESSPLINLLAISPKISTNFIIPSKLPLVITSKDDPAGEPTYLAKMIYRSLSVKDFTHEELILIKAIFLNLKPLACALTAHLPMSMCHIILQYLMYDFQEGESFKLPQKDYNIRHILFSSPTTLKTSSQSTPALTLEDKGSEKGFNKTG